MNLQTPLLAESAVEIRAMLDRVTGSAEFRGSSQLAAFLRLIVEMTLDGETDRIKAYTIGTVALGRDPSFDPQRDPIVRVEANRLRRTLAAYYEREGADDPIVIDVPLGRYVPRFRVRGGDDGPPPPREESPRRHRLSAAVAVLTLLVVVAVVAVRWLPPLLRLPDTAPTPVSALAGAPMVLFEPLQALPASASALAADLDRELARAAASFPNFDIAIASAGGRERAAQAGSRPVYRLTGLVEAASGGSASVTLQLVAGGVVAWSRSWPVGGARNGSAEAVARDAATELFSVFGVIHARLRARSSDLGPGFRCLLAAADYFRKLDMAQHERVRNCLEQTLAEDPKVVTAAALLALVYEREYLIDLPPRPGDAPPLERALLAAERARALDPNNPVAQIATMEARYLRGDLAGAMAAGERALAINPLDPAIASAVGLRLVLSGEIERGAALLEKAAAHYSVNPSWLDFGLFCVAYLEGDMTRAAHHAGLQSGDKFPYGMVANALVAAAQGDRHGARRTLIRLASLYPGWHDPRAMLQRFIRSDEIVERLARDLAAIGAP